MKNFEHSFNGKSVNILLADTHNDREFEKHEFDTSKPTLIVHCESPLTVSLLLENENFTILKGGKFIPLIQSIRFRSSVAQLDKFFTDFITCLPNILAEYRINSPDNMLEEPELSESVCKKITTYYVHAVERMGEGDSFLPVTCPHCNTDLDLACYPGTGFSFEASFNIKGCKFFDCYVCKKPVSKSFIIKSVREVLLDWVNVLNNQLDFFAGTEQKVSHKRRVEQNDKLNEKDDEKPSEVKKFKVA